MKVSFDRLANSIGKPGRHVNEIFIKPENPKELEKRLTFVNKAAQYEINRLKKQPYYSARYEAEKQQKILALEEQVKQELFQEEEGGWYSIPAGFWYLCEVWEDDFHTSEAIPPKILEGTRKYQEEAVRSLLAHNRAMCVLATGLGKSFVIANICNSALAVDKRILIVVPTVDLVDQMVRGLRKINENVCGIGGKWMFKPGSDVAVTTANSAMQYADMFDSLVVDECIPYEQAVLTEIGPIQIGVLHKKWSDGKALPRVKSFNEETGCFEYKEILNVWKKTDRNEIYVIKCGKLKLKATEEHPFLLADGSWKPAKDIVEGDILLGNPGTSKRASIGGVSWNDHQKQIVLGSLIGDGSWGRVGKNKYRLRIIHGLAQSEYCKWKAEILNRPTEVIENNGYSKKPAIRFQTKVFHHPIDGLTKQNCPRQLFQELDIRGISVIFMDDGGVDHGGKQIILHTYACGEDGNEMLAERLRDFGFEARASFMPYKGQRAPGYWCVKIQSSSYENFMREVSPYVHKNLEYKIAEKFRKNVQTAVWDDQELSYATYVVDSVEKQTYIKKTKKGYGIFDIEVKDNHNFVICGGRDPGAGFGDGVVVHNCHHSAASTWMDICLRAKNAKNVYFLTATPYRSDGQDLLIHAFGGPAVYEKDTRWAIENKWLTKPVIIQVTCNPRLKKPLSPNVNNMRAYKTLISQPHVFMFMYEQIQKMLAAGRVVMVLFTTVTAGEAFQKFCEKRGLVFQVAHAKFRKPFNDFKKGETKLLVGNAKLFGEGVDVPNVSAIINCCNNSAEGQTRQIIGRALRLSEGKKDAIVMDIAVTGYPQFERALHNRKRVFKTIVDEIKEVVI